MLAQLCLVLVWTRRSELDSPLFESRWLFLIVVFLIIEFVSGSCISVSFHQYLKLRICFSLLCISEMAHYTAAGAHSDLTGAGENLCTLYWHAQTVKSNIACAPFLLPKKLLCYFQTWSVVNCSINTNHLGRNLNIAFDIILNADLK